MGRMPKGGGRFKLGSPYRVAGRWYVPAEDPNYDRTGVGSWYGDDFHGRRTANGEIFDMHALTAAHPTLPLPSYAYVTNLQNGRTILVRVNDRGPYVRDRIIDLSHTSARALGYDGAGRAHVRVRYAGRAPLNGDDRRERQYLAGQPWYRGGGAAVASAATPPPPYRDAPAYRPTGAWSATDYRARLAGKPLPNANAAALAGRRSYTVSSTDLPPVETAPDPYVTSMRPPRTSNTAANVTGGRLVWRPSPPSQPAPYTTSAVSASNRRSALGGDATERLAGPGSAYVHLGTFRDRAKAEQFREEFAHLGAVEVAATSGGGSPLYRVRIGPMSEPSARAALSEISSRGLSGSRVVFD